MDTHGMPPTTPQLPPTEAILKNHKERKDLREIYQKLLGEFGEDHKATVAIKKQVDVLESK
eukprot:8255057-Karenia_brevis.AAC.1